jgi:hypothetical protein
MANAAMEARRTGIEFVFFVLGIFHSHQSLSFGLQSDGAFQGPVQSCHWLQDVLSGKVAGNFLFLFHGWRIDDLEPRRVRGERSGMLTCVRSGGG